VKKGAEHVYEGMRMFSNIQQQSQQQEREKTNKKTTLKTMALTA
jgi:hypothetical protein